VVCGLGLVVSLLIQNRRWRLIAFALLLIFCIVEIGIVTGMFESSSSSTPELTARDETSFVQRPVIWGAALDIIRDYPLTGVGLNQFRSRKVRADYPIPDFAMTVVPHAHNELLQVGADTGIPGMILYVVWHAALAVMIWRTWRDGDPLVKVVALSAAAGLLAHAIFGLADAITLFDRFTWAYWLLVGLASGAYALTRRKETPDPNAILPGEVLTVNA
jgi:O-antigen ligase